MYRVSELLQKLLCEEFGNGSDIGSSSFITLERRFVWSVKNEDGVYSEGNQSKKAVVECSQGRVSTA